MLVDVSGHFKLSLFARELWSNRSIMQVHIHSIFQDHHRANGSSGELMPVPALVWDLYPQYSYFMPFPVIR